MNSAALQTTPHIETEEGAVSWRFKELGLSKQESRVVELAMEGNIDKQIALEMGISLGTVRVYWKRIRFKTGGSRSEAIANLAKESFQRDFERIQERANTLQGAVDAQSNRENRIVAIEEAFIAASVPLITVECATGEALFASDAFARLCGYDSVDELPDAPFESAAAVVEALSKASSAISEIGLTLRTANGSTQEVTFQGCGNPLSIAVLWKKGE